MQLKAEPESRPTSRLLLSSSPVLATNPRLWKEEESTASKKYASSRYSESTCDHDLVLKCIIILILKTHISLVTLWNYPVQWCSTYGPWVRSGP